MPDIREKVKLLPDCPGVYIMKDLRGDCIYVGKAASLKKRVGSYFCLPPGAPIKSVVLAEKIADFEYIVSAGDVEALILEATLIKKHKPRYNVRLRDDKKYPYIVLSGDEYPGVYLTRRIRNGGGCFFGPYPGADAARKTVKILSRIFRLRTCRGALKACSRPCINYYMSRCSGPCAGKVSPESYNRAVEGAKLFLFGRSPELLRAVRAEMGRASKGLEFERAALIRDQIEALESVSEKQNMDAAGSMQEDYVSYLREGPSLLAGVLMVREGRVVGFESFLMDGLGSAGGPEILSAFVKQRYTAPGRAPSALIMPELPEEADLLVEWLKARRGGRVDIIVPVRGRRRALLGRLDENLVVKIAEAAGGERGKSRLAALAGLAGIAGLRDIPARIECFDAAHISGSCAVGACVVFKDGMPEPAAYRKFRIKDADTRDDAAMLEEMAFRRFSRLLSAKSPLAGLIIVDGGRGQVRGVMRGLASAGARIPVAGFAKRFELFYPPGGGEPVGFDECSPVLGLLRHIRDEAHRTASSYHVRLRAAGATVSALDGVRGVGPGRKRALLRKFGSVDKVAAASEEDLARVEGIGPATARRIKKVLC